jgi:hypothetical protein
MSVLWSCPDPNCPPTTIAPVDVPESGEEAGAEEEARFTTDEVAALLNVPLDTISEWHQEGTGPPGYQTHKESHYRRVDVSGGWQSKAHSWLFARATGWNLQAQCVHDG